MRTLEDVFVQTRRTVPALDIATFVRRRRITSGVPVDFVEFVPIKEPNWIIVGGDGGEKARSDVALDPLENLSATERWRVDSVGDCNNATFFVVAGMGLGTNGAAVAAQPARRREVVVMSVSCAGVTGWAYMVGAEIMQHLIGRLERTLTWVRRRSLVLSSILAHKLGKINLAPQVLVSPNPDAVMQKLATSRTGGAVTVAYAPDYVSGLINNWTQPTGLQRSAVPVAIPAGGRAIATAVRVGSVQASGRPPAGSVSKSIDPSQAARLRARGSITPRNAPMRPAPGPVAPPVAAVSPMKIATDAPQDVLSRLVDSTETPKPVVQKAYVVGDVLFPSLCMRVGHIRPSEEVGCDPVKGHMRQVRADGMLRAFVSPYCCCDTYRFASWVRKWTRWSRRRSFASRWPRCRRSKTVAADDQVG